MESYCAVCDYCFAVSEEAEEEVILPCNEQIGYSAAYYAEYHTVTEYFATTVDFSCSVVLADESHCSLSYGVYDEVAVVFIV